MEARPQVGVNDIRPFMAHCRVDVRDPRWRIDIRAAISSEDNFYAARHELRRQRVAAPVEDERAAVDAALKEPRQEVREEPLGPAQGERVDDVK